MTTTHVEPLARALRESGLAPEHLAAWMHLMHLLLGARFYFEMEMGRIN